MGCPASPRKSKRFQIRQLLPKGEAAAHVFIEQIHMISHIDAHEKDETSRSITTRLDAFLFPFFVARFYIFIQRVREELSKTPLLDKAAIFKRRPLEDEQPVSDSSHFFVVFPASSSN